MWYVKHLQFVDLTFSVACQFCKGTENTNELIKIPSPINNNTLSCFLC